MGILQSIWGSIPGFQSILAAFLLVCMCTKNGKAIVKNYGSKGARFILSIIPYPIRILLVQGALSLGIPYVRMVLSIIHTPQGEQTKWVSLVKKDTWKGHWIFPFARQLGKSRMIETSMDNADLIILYMHGGGFYFGSSVSYIKSFIELVTQFKKSHGLKARILSVEYSLSPSVQWPKQNEQCLDAYMYLVHTLGISPSKIFLAGDSAGGNLALGVILALRNQRSNPALAALAPIPMPAGVIPISPWADLEIDEASCEAAKYRDILNKRIFTTATMAYLPQLKAMTPAERVAYVKNPEISPLFGNYQGACPMLVVYAEKELLATSIIKLVEQLKKQGVPLKLLVRSGAAHIHLVESLCSPTDAIWREDLGVVAEWCKATLVAK
ncbi:Alpha/Beta hydrolase protein [Phycomyces nitens]|nr:Alpha/Beta hydrolase protein [Phycomyces nitens]